MEKTALWDLNEICNLRCEYCYPVFDTESTKSPDADFETIKNKMMEVKNAGVTRIYFVGGEPFLRKDLESILRLSKELNFTNIITTNATIKTAYKNTIMMSFVDEIEVSLDSMDDEYLKSVGRNAKVQGIKDSLELFIKMGIKVRVISTLTKKNIGMIHQVADYCFSVGISMLKLQAVYIPPTHPLFSKLALLPEHTIFLKDFAKSIYEWSSKLEAYFDHLIDVSTTIFKSHHCSAYAQFMYIDKNCLTYRCPTIRKPAVTFPFFHEPQQCTSMSNDCLCLYSNIEGIYFDLKQSC